MSIGPHPQCSSSCAVAARHCPTRRFGLTAIHAVELYLNAFLLRHGHSPSQVRKLQHDLLARAELAIAGGLTLRKRTAEHLRSLSAGREYLVSRYAPELAETMSQINRLAATLDEVANKVSKAGAIAR
jgi:hypothetical protein